MRAKLTAWRQSLISRLSSAPKTQTASLRTQTSQLKKLIRVGLVVFILAFDLGLPAELFNVQSVDLGPLHFKLSDEAKATAGINQQINFQARLLNSAGAVVPDGNYNMQFKIYQDGDGVLGGGDETLKWTESRLNNNSQGVVVKNGYFSVNLGSVTAFGASVDWNQDTLWLSLNIGSTNGTCTPFSSCSGDGEMSPFKRLAANPYALNSNQLGGLTSSQYVQLAQGLQADASTTNASIAINKTGSTANILDLQRSGASVLLIDNNGTATHQATGDNVSLKVKQTSTASPTADIFDVLGANGTSKFIAVTSTAANQGSVTVQSLGSNDLTLDGGSGNVVLGSNTTTLKKSGTALTVDINSASNSTLTIANNAAGVASLSVEGTVTAGTGIIATTGGVTATAGDINATAGNIQTAGTTRISNTGAFTGTTATLTNTSTPLILGTTNTATLVPASSGGAQSFTFPVAGGTFCVQNSSACGFQTAGNYIVQAPTSTAVNTIQTATNAVVGLSIKGKNGQTADLLDIYDSQASPALQAFFDSTGSLNVSKVIQPTANNSSDIGLSGTTFRTGYFGTSVFSPSFTGAGAVTLSSGGAADLTLDAASNILVLADATIRHAAAGTTSVELNDSSADTTLSVTNTDGTRKANLSVEGSITGNSLSIGSTAQFTVSSTGSVSDKTTVDSSTAFQILNSGNISLVNVDTTNGNITSNQGILTLNGVSNPANATLSGSPSGGTLPASTTFAYRIASVDISGTIGQAVVTTPTSITTAGGPNNNQNTISWNAVTGAQSYRVYRTINGGTNWFVNTIASGTTSIVDNGTNFTWATAGTPSNSSPRLSLPGGSGAAFGSPNGGSITLQAPTSAVTSYAVNLPSSQGTANTTLINDGSGNLTWSTTSCGACVVLAPTTTATNTVQTATNGVVDLTLKGKSGQTADILDIYDSQTTPALQAFFDSAGALNVSKAIQPTANNSSDLGLSGTTFRTGYFGTSVLAPAFDVGTAGTLSVGTSTATAITLGKSGVTTTNAGPLTVSQLLTGSLGATVSGATIALNVGSNFATNINTGGSTGTVTIGNGSAPLVIDSTGFDVTSLGAVTTASATLTAANALTLGTASSNTGAIVLKGSGNSNQLTLQGPASPAAGNFTLSIPAITGNANVCTDNSVCSGYAAVSPSGSYLQRNATDTSAASITAANYLYTFTNNNGTPTTGSVLKVDNSANTGSTLVATTSGNPASGSAVIFASDTNGTPSGNLLDLQSGSSPTSKFSVNTSGNVTAAGTYNTNTFTSSALTFGSSAATVSTPSGDLTLQAGSGNIVVGTSTTLFKSGTSFTIDTDSASASTLTVTNLSAGAGNLSVKTNVFAPTFDTPSGTTTLHVGTNNATTAIDLDQSTVIAAGKALTVTSGLTSLTGATSGDALNVSNSTSTGNIAVFKDNSTAVATIGDNGATSFSGIQPASGNGVDVLTVTGGKGANTATAGTGGNLSLTAGAGGNGATTNGNGGNVTLSGGLAGTGGGTAGTVGYVLLQPTSGGRVGIATSTPGNYALDINGDTNIGNNLFTGGTQRLSSTGVLGNITGYTQTSGNFSQSGAGTHSITSTATSGSIFSVTDNSLTANNSNLTNLSVTNNNSGAAGTTVNGLTLNLANTTPTSSTNVIEGINFAGVSTGSNQAFYGLNFGTNYTDILRYNSTQLISGAGKVQNAAFDNTLTYSNIANLSNITTGTINSQTISSTANFTGTVAIQGANSLTLGTTGTSTGSIAFKGSTAASGTITLSLATNNPGTRAINLPDEAGTLCIQGSTNCGFVATSTALARNAHDTSSVSFVGNLYDFTNTNTGAAGVVSFTNSGTNSAISILQSGTSEPSSGQALILANNNTITPTGNLLDLQNKGTSNFSVDVAGNETAAGNLTVTGTYNTNTFNSSTLTFGAAGTATISSAASRALNLTGNAGSTLSTTAGDLTLQAGSGTLNVGTSTSLFKSGTAFSIDLNNSSSSKLSVTNSGTGNGILSVKTAYQINGAVPTAGHYLRGDGSVGYVDSTIQASDIPDISASYIKNTTTVQTTANFAIQSNSSSAVGGLIRAASGQTADNFDIQTALSGNAVRFGVGAGDYTDTSGTKTFLTVAPSFAPTATSTANFVAASIQPTINFGGGPVGAGTTTALLVNPTYTSAPSGTNLIADFQAGGSSKVNINSAGKLTVTGGGIDNTSGGITNAGSITGVGTNITASGATTLASGSSSALTITANAASTWSSSAGALTITSAAAATWSASSGALTLQSGSGGSDNLVFKSTAGTFVHDPLSSAAAILTTPNVTSANSKDITLQSGTTTTSGTTGAVNILSGNSAGSSGNVVIDAGTAGATVGQVQIGNTNASVVTVGSLTKQLTLQGASSTSSLAFKNSTFTTTITATNPTAARSIVFPDAGGTVCTTTASTCSGTYLTAGNFLSRTLVDTATVAVTSGNADLYTFTNSSSAVASGVVKLDNGTNTNSALQVTASGNPASGQAIIFGSNTNASPTGNLIDLQAGSSPTSKFSVTAAGAVTEAGGLTVSSGGINNSSGNITNAGSITGVGANITGAGAVTLASAAATALTVTSNAAATWSTSSGDLTIQAGSGTLNVGSSTTIFKSGTALTLDLNNASASKLTVTNSGAGSGTLSVKTAYQINGAVGTAGHYLRDDGTSGYVDGTIQAGDLPSLSGTYLRNVPAATSDNTVTPTAANTVGLTVNGTSGTAAPAVQIAQTGAANALTVTGSSNATTDLVKFTDAVLNPGGSGSVAALNITYSDADTAGIASVDNVSGITLTPTVNVSSGTALGTHNMYGLNLGGVTNTACAAGTCNRFAIFAPTNSNWDSLFEYNGTVNVINNTGQLNLSSVFNTLAVANGGTGNASATAYALQAGGTTSTGAHQSLTTGSSGNILVSGGSAALPTWQANTAVNTCSDCLIQNPLTTGRNTVSPTTASVVGLTVNATNSTAATTAIFNQGQGADNVSVNTTNTTGTQTNGILFNRNGTGGTTTNGIQIQQTLGTLTNGLVFSGTITNDITAASGRGLTVVGNAASTISTTSGALTLTSAAAATWSSSAGLLTVQGSTSGLTLTTATTGVVTLDSGTTGAVNIGGNANAKTITIGNTTGATAVTIQAGTGQINVGNDGIAKTLNFGNSTGATAVNIDTGTGGLNIGDDANTKSIDIGGVTNSGTDTVNIATNSTAADTINIGNTASATVVNLKGGTSGTTSGAAGVYVGSATTDSTQTNLQLDSSNSNSDAGTCSATVNQGAMYYSTQTNSIRACTDSAWGDIITSNELGLQMFGVVPDSGTTPGDLIGFAGTGTGPCKVIKASATTVTWTACSAYSNGRRVNVTAGTSAAVTTTASANRFQWLCLNGTNNQPTLTAANAAETGNQPTFSATAPILCLALIEDNGGLLNLTPNITNMWDMRTFTNTTKEEVSIGTGVSPAMGETVQLVSGGTTGQLQVTTTASDKIIGVVVATNGGNSGAAMNAIVATAGPAWIRAQGSTAGDYVILTTTAGQVSTSTTAGGAYSNAGISQSYLSTTCSNGGADDCRSSLFTILNIR